MPHLANPADKANNLKVRVFALWTTMRLSYASQSTKSDWPAPSAAQVI